MRKRYRAKRRSCGLCKPHKRGLTKRWKPRDQALLRAAESDESMRAHAVLALEHDRTPGPNASMA